jgi:DNA polymerase-3 subunit alpha
MNRLECKNMKDLKTNCFGDLIAMNALYRPGPLEYIPSFVRRKMEKREIKYDLDACEEYLGEKPTELPFTKSR